jgi:hypothetical protein
LTPERDDQFISDAQAVTVIDGTCGDRCCTYCPQAGASEHAVTELFQARRDQVRGLSHEPLGVIDLKA